MVNFDPADASSNGMESPPIPRFIIKMVNENRPSIAPKTQGILQADIDRYRRNARIRRIDLPETPGVAVQGGTVAVLRTDIPGLEDRPYGGASPEAIPEQYKLKSGTSGGLVLIPINPVCANHAEHVAMENLRIAIERSILAGKLRPSQLTGCRVIMRVEQEPCSSCAAGLRVNEDGQKSAGSGVIKQFSLMFPGLLIEVRSARTSRSYLVRAGCLEP
jgi:hypothetical protein